MVVGAQANGGICQTLPFGRELAARGYHVALFEWRLPEDAAMGAATSVLTEAGARKIVVGGFSQGAVIGLGAAPGLGDRVVGVLSVSGGPSASDGYPTVRSVSRFDGPLLLVGARDDTVFPKGTDAAIAARHRGRSRSSPCPATTTPSRCSTATTAGRCGPPSSPSWPGSRLDGPATGEFSGATGSPSVRMPR